MKNKKLLIGLGAVAVLGAVGYFIWKKRQSLDSVSRSGTSGENCIEVTDSIGGGKGKYVSIRHKSDYHKVKNVKKGDSVKFNGKDHNVTKTWSDKNGVLKAIALTNHPKTIAVGSALCI